MDNQTTPAAKFSTGAFLRTVHADRSVKVYPLDESDIKLLSTYNNFSTLFFAMFSALVSFAFGIWTNFHMLSDPPPAAVALYYVVMPLLIVAGLVCLVVAGGCMWRRESEWGRMKKETVGEGDA